MGRLGEVAAALEPAREAVELAPFAESGYARLMRLQVAAGERAEALRTFHRCRELLARELGVDPGPEIQAAYLDALRTSAEPRHAGQAADVAAGQPSSGVPVTGNLPIPTDRFVGRDSELETVAAALGSSRLVTLTGVGGVGKSRLALEISTRLAPAYLDGPWQCELSPVAAEQDVTHAVATAFSLSQEQRLSTEESIVRYLRDKRLLLVIDNCEHVLGSVAALLTTVLAHCANVRVLATSRERLGIGGEHVIEVPPLAVPAVGSTAVPATSRVAAVERFCVRAAAERAGFALTFENVATVGEICRRLDGLPLAIELAAARVAALGVDEIATRLNQRFWLLRGKAPTRPARSHSLRATVDWSYGLLTAEQQHVFDRLSVFAGRFTLAAAETVCGTAPTDSASLVDAVFTLADKSMVIVDTTATPTRYRLLETLRQYGHERLDQSGEMTATAQRHARYFVAQAERLTREMQGPDEARAVATFDATFDDLRAAYRWCIAHREADYAARLSAALYWYGLFHQRSEVFIWAEETLPLVTGHPALPFVCATAGVGAWARGDRGRALELGHAGVLAAGGGTDARLALDVLASVALFEGRLEEACGLWEQALAAGQEAGDDFHASHMAANAALACGYRGDLTRARQLADVARAIAGVIENPTAEGWARYVSGEILMNDDPSAALPLLDEGVHLARSVDNRFILGVALLSASSLRSRHGDPQDAVPMLLETIRHWQRAGNWTQQWTTLRNVIELLVRPEAHRPAAVLLGGVESAATAAPAFGPDAERIAAARVTLTARLGDGVLTRLRRQGEAMQPQALVRFACTELGQARAPRHRTT